ncbi:hypothetical protein [Thalassoglobus polymorphus]|uniref:Uncharacterized protein n=1 Tax=Thalassoglobus polymorphus TaxID=2527994 RepID=A0A517QHM9_9PLAN|nr:hypothetical protein [Thalassoglobus polymorphus]QDT31067.1 hypothetical protein Mal48_02980 [Thalassoglobus polymorphus]
MTTPQFDVAAAHRWFAIECNNGSWDLVEAESRTETQIEEMLHLAHAARFHWQHAGTELNLLKADLLLATAYCIAKRPENGLVYASHARAHLNSIKDANPFDHACLAGASALAHQLAGQEQQAAQARNEFKQRLEEIDDSSEKELLLQLYPVP